MGFIEDIAPLVQKYAPKYDVCIASSIIGQAVLESASGTSELATNAHNYFGLKYHSEVASDYYIKVGSEQNPDGSYSSSVMKWCKFNSLEECVEGYFKFLFGRSGVTRYDNLKNEKDPYQYLVKIKADGYATSQNYVENVWNVVNKYNLTQFDNWSNSMIINVHAGHNPDGKTACGAIGLIKESTENRAVKDLVIKYLREQGHTVYDCTVDDGTSSSDVLQKIVKKCNAHTVNLDVSIHFNSGANDKTGNGVTTGTEVLVYSTSSKSNTYAKPIVNAIAELGFKNRGVKTRTDLYFLKNTKAPALLVECCFVDDKDDVTLYNADAMAKKIVKGITGVEPQNYIVCPHCGGKIYV